MIKRFLFLAVILAIMIAAYASGLLSYISFASLKANRQLLIDHAAQHKILAPILFALLYAVLTSISFPGAAILTVISGFILKVPTSTIAVCFGATAGAFVIFLAAKTALGDILRKKAGKLVSKMEKGFSENEISYMLFLRLVPLFPFWVVNIAPAFFGVKPINYLWTTFVGIIPGTFVYTQAGAGLGEIFDSGEKFSLENILNLKLKIALGAIAVLALVPILYKLIKKRRNSTPKTKDK